MQPVERGPGVGALETEGCRTVEERVLRGEGERAAGGVDGQDLPGAFCQMNYCLKTCTR